MKKFISLLIFSGAVVAITAAGLPVVFAQSDSASSTPAEKGHAEMRAAVNIEPNGNIKLVGKLTAVSGSTLTVQSWAGNWSVDASGAKIVKSDYKVGDWVIVWGQASEAALTVKAKMVKDESGEGWQKKADLGNASTTVSVTLTTDKPGFLKRLFGLFHKENNKGEK